MLHAPLVLTTAKLDISLLLKSSPTPPPISPAPTKPPLLRSTSVPAAVSYRPPTSSSQRTSTSSCISSSAAQPAPSSPSLPYLQTQRQHLPASNTSSAYPSSHLSPRSASQKQAPHHSSAKRPSPSVPHPSASPAKRQSKWTPEEDALIVMLRAPGMKWEEISQRLPGRSAISCRLHYQNYIERRSEWDDEKKDRLARLYERLKPDMWTPLAKELGVPWRSAEYIHWQLGEAEMARRAGVVPFAMVSTAGSSSQPSVAMLPVGAGATSSFSEDPRSGPRHLRAGTASSSQSPVVMLPAGVGGTPYPSENLRSGPGYFTEGVPGRSSFDSGENLGRTLRRRGTVSPGGAGGSGGGSSRATGSNFPHGAVLPSLAELDRGITAFDSGTTSKSSAGHGVPAGRGIFYSEQRGRGRP
ncbi:hypothetical protein MMC17_008062 [Xylographa soralifera]|nr:hypothetical protein [Xylographa soralifera]